MALLKTLLITLLFLWGNCSEYQLDFDWKLNKLSTDIEYGYATWNNNIVVNIKQLVAVDTQHHARMGIDFSEGMNQLTFFFIGLKGEITIDNVAITKPPKTINLLANGDFQQPQLQSTSSSMPIKGGIPGWQGQGQDMIMCGRSALSVKPSQAMLLNSQNKNINQKISFGKISKYSFISTMNSEIQNMATNLIQQNLNSISQNISTSWSNSGTTNQTSSSNPSGDVNAVQTMMGSIMSGNSTSISSQIASDVLLQLSKLKVDSYGANATAPAPAPVPVPAQVPSSAGAANSPIVPPAPSVSTP